MSCVSYRACIERAFAGRSVLTVRPSVLAFSPSLADVSPMPWPADPPARAQPNLTQALPSILTLRRRTRPLPWLLGPRTKDMVLLPEGTVARKEACVKDASDIWCIGGDESVVRNITSGSRLSQRATEGAERRIPKQQGSTADCPTAASIYLCSCSARGRLH